jgi:hypothetical protein
MNVAPIVTELSAGGADIWKLLIIGDRFGQPDKDEFDRHCRDLAEHIGSQLPFSEAGIGDRIRIASCFTPTTPKGMFGCEKQAERRIFGKPERVRKYLAKHGLGLRRNDLVLVLMNFPERGGAGEFVNENIAWTTPVDTRDPATGDVLEHWPDVALHELGHAFDLDDEYEQPWADAPQRPPKRNVCASAQSDDPPWKELFGDQPPARLRSSDRLFDRPDWPRDYPTAQEIAAFGATEVGMFQGARYSSEAYWRSALTCKMRSAPQPFCKVCRTVIRESILSNH